MEVIYPKRAIDYSDSSSRLAGEKKKRKTTANEFLLDETRFEELYPPSMLLNRPLFIRKAKLKVREYQFYFKSIGQSERAMIIRAPQDVKKLTAEELQSFAKKGWNFGLLAEMKGDGNSFDYYQCLKPDKYSSPEMKIDLFNEYRCVISTYDIDKEYGKFYHYISDKIAVGMEWGQVEEIARNACKKFPGFHISVVNAACHDCIRSKELENWREERVDMNFHLWHDIFNKNRLFWDVIGDIYNRELHLYPRHAHLLVCAFNEDMRGADLQTQFDKFCEFVKASSGLSCDKVDAITLEGLAKQFAEKECVIKATYAEYIEKKMKLAQELGILQCEGAD